MSAITDLSLFIAAGLLLNVTPGADMLYVLSRGAGPARGCGGGAGDRCGLLRAQCFCGAGHERNPCGFVAGVLGAEVRWCHLPNLLGCYGTAVAALVAGTDRNEACCAA